MRWFSFLFVFLFMACSSDAASQAMPKVSNKGDSIVQNSKGAAPTVKLNSGFDMPVLGLGTWTLRGKVAEDAVYVAIKNGYRLIDTAKYYDNEEAVGKGIRRAIDDGLVKREDLFVTSKLVPWSSSLDEDIDDSLEKLGLEYIDLMLLHQHGSDAEDKAVYKAMERAVKAKKIRSIGISHYYTEKTAKRFFADFEIKPAVVQNENQNKACRGAKREPCVLPEHGIQGIRKTIRRCGGILLPAGRARPHRRCFGEQGCRKDSEGSREIGRTGGVALACAIGLHCHSGLQEP